jgi:hypothetical protein
VRTVVTASCIGWWVLSITAPRTAQRMEPEPSHAHALRAGAVGLLVVLGGDDNTTFNTYTRGHTWEAPVSCIPRSRSRGHGLSPHRWCGGHP